MKLMQSLRELVANGRFDMRDLDQARQLINCMLLRLACQQGTAEDFAQIEVKIAEIESLAGAHDTAKRAEAVLEYFQLITSAAHNEVLSVVAQSLGAILSEVFETAPRRQGSSELNGIRRIILSCLSERDADGAEAAMGRYFARVRQT